MPNWNQILNEIKEAGSTHDVIRRAYLTKLHELTGRNVIAYYSGWLQKPGDSAMAVNDEDKTGFMSVIHELDRSKGLDLLLHTPGGGSAATESLVDYLRSMFDTDIRAIIPQLALSAGTMIACAAREILMGKHSSLGPIDPQLNGIPAHAVVEEFQRAGQEIKADPAKVPVWQPIIAKYPPTFIGECEKAIEWSTEMTSERLRSGMFAEDDDATEKIAGIIRELADHSLTKSHDRHLSLDRCRQIGLHVFALEDEHELQEAVLSVHHSFVLTFASTPAVKIIENQRGVAFVKKSAQMVIAQ